MNKDQEYVAPLSGEGKTGNIARIIRRYSNGDVLVIGCSMENNEGDETGYRFFVRNIRNGEYTYPLMGECAGPEFERLAKLNLNPPL